MHRCAKNFFSLLKCSAIELLLSMATPRYAYCSEIGRPLIQSLTSSTASNLQYRFIVKIVYLLVLTMNLKPFVVFFSCCMMLCRCLWLMIIKISPDFTPFATCLTPHKLSAAHLFTPASSFWRVKSLLVSPGALRAAIKCTPYRFWIKASHVGNSLPLTKESFCCSISCV